MLTNVLTVLMLVPILEEFVKIIVATTTAENATTVTQVTDGPAPMSTNVLQAIHVMLVFNVITTMAVTYVETAPPDIHCLLMVIVSTSMNAQQDLTTVLPVVSVVIAMEPLLAPVVLLVILVMD